ncbi:uncharacterized protein ISCGN_005100 [Ixodes scapularis]
MASEEIFDTQLHASSIDDSGPYHFTNARLNAEYGWCAGPSDAQRYLQVDLQNHTRITGIILQGMSTPVKSGYVIAFHLTFSNDSIYWTSEEQPVGHRKVYTCHQCELSTFTADQGVRYNLLRGIVARYVKLQVLKWNKAPCLRLELIGCRSQVNCGAVLEDSEGAIASPNHPFYYGQDKSCWWKILPPPGKHVWLSFIIFDLAQREASSRAGQCQDQLLLYPGHSAKSNCSDSILSPNGHTFPKEIISNGPMEIHLKTCFRYSLSRFSGFYATYKITATLTFSPSLTLILTVALTLSPSLTLTEPHALMALTPPHQPHELMALNDTHCPHSLMALTPFTAFTHSPPSHPSCTHGPHATHRPHTPHALMAHTPLRPASDGAISPRNLMLQHQQHGPPAFTRSNQLLQFAIIIMKFHFSCTI